MWCASMHEFMVIWCWSVLAWILLAVHSTFHVEYGVEYNSYTHQKYSPITRIRHVEESLDLKIILYENYMNRCVRSFLFKTSDLANGASAVHFVMNAFYITLTYLAASSRLFLGCKRGSPRKWRTVRWANNKMVPGPGALKCILYCEYQLDDKHHWKRVIFCEKKRTTKRGSS